MTSDLRLLLLSNSRDPQGRYLHHCRDALAEHLRGERRVEVGDDERDGLRRLVGEERDDLLGRRLAQELERPALHRRRQAGDDLRHRPAGVGHVREAGHVAAGQLRLRHQLDRYASTG